MTARPRFQYTASAELSITRINRLLRPLRNKCGILASATSRSSGLVAPITYSSSPSLETRVPPSLDVLRDPKLVVSRAHQESRSLDALARQIYAVTNAYRNVVQAALPNDVSTSRRQVLALTDICAASVGRNIQAEVARCVATLEEPDEAEETALVDELYESVPARFRRWTLVAHATSVIVDTCPNHPMLMLSLLGVTLAHGLLTESKIFLRLFLTAMVRSPRHGVPPAIAHPMYPSYLVELCFEWTHLASEPRAGAFTQRTFVAVILEVLMEHGPTTAWTCKSITRLAQLLRTRDFGCFLGFLHGLIAVRPQHADHHDRDESRALFSRLAKWTGVITSDFFATGNGEGSGAAVRADQFYSIVEILASAYDAGLHLSTPIDDGTDLRDPQTALACAATHCLSAPLFPTVSAPRRNAILALLREVPPNSSTFDGTFADQPLARLRVLAGALRAHDLGALESALWACAVERSSRAGAGVDPALRAVLVDAAEREREDAVGSWVRQTASSTRSPLKKRARREPETAPSKTWRRRWGVPSSSSCCSTSLPSAASTPVLSSASSSSARSLSGSPVPGEVSGVVGVLSEDEETSRSRGASCLARRTSAKFKSVLADALSTRMDLKAERRRASLHAGLVCSRRGRAVSSESSDDHREEDARCALPSEGDVLDMFAYDGDF